MVMDFTQYDLGHLFDIVSSPGFNDAVIRTGKTIRTPRNEVRKIKIKNLFKFLSKIDSNN